MKKKEEEDEKEEEEEETEKEEDENEEEEAGVSLGKTRQKKMPKNDIFHRSSWQDINEVDKHTKKKNKKKKKENSTLYHLPCENKQIDLFTQKN